ncbi:MAG: DUF1080 domain-containing protein [Gemmataceae bacterium]|nr:DUF1080 domain-containing protein [Gemmataceae bacterium]MDW8266736.1 DUF1080 domain-containing protein [Gemmataceae bacterium]
MRPSAFISVPLLLAVVSAALLGHAHAPSSDVIHLFNGKDLSNFYTYLAAPRPGEPPYGKNNDPEKVFTVHDGMIHISGKVFGGLITEKEYENYHLITEFRWGEKTYPPRQDRARDSGILLHCVGEEGAVGGVWMDSIECQIIEGGTGDILLVGSKSKPSVTVRAVYRTTTGGGKERQEAYYSPGGEPRVFTAGRINWFGRDPAWKDVRGFRGKNDVEKPVGEWNTLECVCDGSNLTYRLNDVVVNAATNASRSRGKILFQSEGAEIFFRKIDLKPLR